MAPRVELTSNGHKAAALKRDQQDASPGEYKMEILWKNIAMHTVIHIGALIGLYQCFTSAKWKTVAAAYIFYQIGILGITVGAHRMWSHRSFKATLPLQILLMLMNSMAYQNSILQWSRDHRVHHKYSETDADPHNAKRGFFFAHMGWLFCKKHPEVANKGRTVDITDLVNDPVLLFQERYYGPLVLVLCFLVPTLVPYLGWDETLYNSFFICGLLKYVLNLHGIWLVNSVAHMWGRRPYDKNINPSENRFVSVLGLGEGFHNYHHTFAWDYSASELGYDLNISKMFIDFFALFGWAYDRKVVSPQVIKQRKARTGDISEAGPYGPN